MSDFIVCRKLKLTLLSATDVENVSKHSKSEVYAKVTIGDKKTGKKVQTTPTDTNPEWNHQMEFIIAAKQIHRNSGLHLLVELYADRARGDRRHGHVYRSINELFESAVEEGNTRLALPLKTDEGVTKGVVTLEYSFGEETSVKKLSSIKKLVNTGAAMAVGVAITCTTGLDLETPYRVFDGPEIVGEGSRGS
ncbi:hypothetical protein LguiB_009901 [Lonicera macranthoides]